MQGLKSFYTRAHFSPTSSNIHVSLQSGTKGWEETVDVAIQVQKVQLPETSLNQRGGRSECETGDRYMGMEYFLLIRVIFIYLCCSVKPKEEAKLLLVCNPLRCFPFTNELYWLAGFCVSEEELRKLREETNVDSLRQELDRERSKRMELEQKMNEALRSR